MVSFNFPITFVSSSNVTIETNFQATPLPWKQIQISHVLIRNFELYFYCAKNFVFIFLWLCLFSATSVRKMFDATDFTWFMVFLGVWKTNADRHRWHIDVALWWMCYIPSRWSRLYVRTEIKNWTKLSLLRENLSENVECVWKDCRSMRYNWSRSRANHWTYMPGH